MSDAGKQKHDTAMSLDADKLRVFISYARRDASDFAEYLVVALKLAGFSAYLDRHDIAKAEDWESRLSDLIASSDTVVFIITPTSIKSERCGWEVKRTLSLGKRLVPVQWIAVPEAEVPAELKRLNYTIFSSGEFFGGALAELTDTLRQDLSWLRQQTQLDEEAARWHARKRDPDLLLRGNALSEARAWMFRRKPEAPEISPLLTVFIGTSEEAETARLSDERKHIEEREELLKKAEAAVAREAEAQRAGARARKIIAWGSAAVAVLMIVGVSGYAYQVMQKFSLCSKS